MPTLNKTYLISDKTEGTIEKGQFRDTDNISRVDNVRHTSGIFFMLDIASKGNIVGMIRQMTTAF